MQQSTPRSDPGGVVCVVRPVSVREANGVAALLVPMIDSSATDRSTKQKWAGRAPTLPTDCRQDATPQRSTLEFNRPRPPRRNLDCAAQSRPVSHHPAWRLDDCKTSIAGSTPVAASNDSPAYGHFPLSYRHAVYLIRQTCRQFADGTRRHATARGGTDCHEATPGGQLWRGSLTAASRLPMYAPRRRCRLRGE